MNADIVKVLEDLGFEVRDQERVISGVITKSKYGFVTIIDRNQKLVNLTFTHDILQRSLLSFQKFENVDELKKILLDNQIFTSHYQEI
jgi:hypothetical protein